MTPLQKFNLYPLGDKFVANIPIAEDPKQRDPSKIKTFVLLDRSFSMGDNAKRLLRDILPSVFSQLAYDKEFYLVTFSNTANVAKVAVDNMKTKSVETFDEGSNLASAIKICSLIISKLSSQNPIRLLTIYNGDDQSDDATSLGAASLAEMIERKNFSVNSQAVRFFTSKAEPGVVPLARMLQVNNTAAPKLIDIYSSESDRVIARKIAQLFINDKLEYTKLLTTKNEIISKTPWSSDCVNQILLKPGNNIFWLNKYPINTLVKIGEVPAVTKVVPKPDEDPSIESDKKSDEKSEKEDVLEFKIAEVPAKFTLMPMDQKIFSEISQEFRDRLTSQLKVLKVAGTVKTSIKLSKIVDCFAETEESLMKDDDKLKSKRKSCSEPLKEILKKDIDAFDVNQKARYLKGEAVACRSVKTGFIVATLLVFCMLMGFVASKFYWK